MTKHELACVAYVRANAEIRRLTRLIGIQISNCREAKAKAQGEDPEYCITDCCLPEYYRAANMARNAGYYNEEGPEPLDCEFCEEADRLIQLRKDARRTLGAAKRQITVLGKSMINHVEAQS